MNGRSVCYLMSWPAHAPYLATSLLTLRRHWPGKVKVYTWPESEPVVRMLCEDENIVADCIVVSPSYKGRNDQFLHKIELMQQADGRSNLYLDADTLVAGSINEMFAAAEEYGFAATQFGTWTTAGSVIRNRIKRLREFPIIPADLIDDLLAFEHPSLNGGVFSCMPNNSVCSIWHSWSDAAKSIFIADECVLHLMPLIFEQQDRMVVMSGRFNSSPKYTPKEDEHLVRIWHGHGDCWVRPSKSRLGVQMWWSVFTQARKINLGGIRGWEGSVGNKYLNDLLRREQKSPADELMWC